MSGPQLVFQVGELLVHLRSRRSLADGTAEHRRNEPDKLLGDGRTKFDEGRRFLADRLQQQIGLIRRDVWRPPREELKQHRAQAVHVAFGGDVARVQNLFGGHVTGRTHALVDDGDVQTGTGRSRDFGDAKIQDFDAFATGHGVVLHQHDVGWFQITVDDAFFVGGAQDAGDLCADAHGVQNRQLSTRRAQPLAEGGPNQQIHHQISRTIGQRAGFGHLHHTGVPDAVGGFGFVPQPLEKLGLTGQHGARDDLDSDAPLQVAVFGFVDRTETSLPNLPQHGVVTNRPGHRHGKCRISREKAFWQTILHGVCLAFFWAERGEADFSLFTKRAKTYYIPRVMKKGACLWRLLFRRWIALLVLLLASLLVAQKLFFRFTLARSPTTGTQPPQLVQTVKPNGDVHVGPSWQSRERGILELHLMGDPLTLGYSHGRLGSPQLVKTEDYLFGEMRRYVPSSLAMSFIKTGVLYRQRHLLSAVPARLQLELAGLADGQPDGQGDFLPAFQRVVFYHALHDITQTLEHSPLLGCTAIAASGTATVDGHLYVGRNFDFEGPPLFDTDKAILFFQPEGKLAFASVAWAGMAGVVTGLNQEGIYASVNALRTDDKSDRGLPVELLLRDVLERAHTLEEAIAVAQEHPALVPDLYLFADGKSGEAAVIERSPTRFSVTRSRDVLAVANHARTAPFANDQANERLRTYLTSGARQTRADELLKRYRGSLDAAGMLQILRDKRGVNDKELGLGNRNALDALIATHSVVVDVTDRVIWVGKGPHALGEYVGFDVRRELGDVSRPEARPLPLPEDPTLHTPEYRSFLAAGLSLHAVQVAQKREQWDLAVLEAERAQGLVPLSAEAALALADALFLRGDQHKDRRATDWPLARAAYERFLTLSPPHKVDVEHAQARLTRLAAFSP